jgi:hypothetical protein
LIVAPRRYDGTLKFSYPVDALDLSPTRWVVHGVFGPEVEPHSQRLGFFPGDHTIEIYTPGRWSNVNAVFGPAGERRGFYCNLATPPERHGDEIRYTDLDLDLLVRADGSQVVLDEDEYAERADRYGYPPGVRAAVATALQDLSDAATAMRPPFDGLEAASFLRLALGPAAAF